MAEASELRDQIAAALWRHKMARPTEEPVTWCVCLCWSVTRGDVASDGRAYEAHVADALLPLIREREARLVAEAERNLRDWRDECLRWRDDAEKEPERLRKARTDGAAEVRARVGAVLSDLDVPLDEITEPGAERIRAALAAVHERVEAVPDWLAENGMDPQSVEFVRANLKAALADTDGGVR